MLKITDMIVSAILKKGILCEARNCNMEFEVPSSELGEAGVILENKIKVTVKVDHMTVRIEKE